MKMCAKNFFVKTLKLTEQHPKCAHNKKQLKNTLKEVQKIKNLNEDDKNFKELVKTIKKFLKCFNFLLKSTESVHVGVRSIKIIHF